MEKAREYTLLWDPHIIYKIRGNCLFEKDFKAVYTGEFIGSAPKGLRSGVQYCIKQIRLNYEGNKFPQFREYYDLVDFHGDYLRQIFACNELARNVGEQLRRTGHYTIDSTAQVCYIVEPLYKSSREKFEECGKLTVLERLELIHQFVLGCCELGADVNRIGGKRVIAHRDIKYGNGLLDDNNHLRLIDFASIRLESDDPSDQFLLHFHVQKDSTASTPFSPSNTAPEDVLTSRYTASEKTDVYALGMMLASLFFRVDGKYDNPNLCWAKVQGWSNDAITTLNNLRNGFSGCVCIDQNASWDKTWIETSLHNSNKNIGWEELADQNILNMIRKLFFASTRIDPARRIGLAEFRAQLEETIEKARNSNAKLPVAVFLFDRSSANSYKSSYLIAASKVYTDLVEQARQKKTPAPYILCVSYHKLLSSTTSPGDAVSLISDPPCSGMEALSKAVRSIQSYNGTSGNPVIFALAKAMHYLVNYSDKYVFSGYIHLFTPEIPKKSEMLPVYLRGVEHDIHQFCYFVAGQHDDVLPLIWVHSADKPDSHSEEPMWYSHEPLSLISASSNFSDRASQDPQHTPPRPATEDMFYTSDHSPYILTDDGKKFYVGLK